MSRSQPRRIGLIALPGVQALEFAGPFDAFRRAQFFSVESGRPSPYEMVFLGLTPDPIAFEGGLQMTLPQLHNQVDELDTLLLIGGFETPSFDIDQAMLAWLRATSPSIRRVCSVCAGGRIQAANATFFPKEIVAYGTNFSPS